MPTQKLKRRALVPDGVAPETVPIIPVQTTFRHMEPSPAVAARIDAEVQKLGRYYDRIGHCHVVVIAPVQHHSDRQYAVHLEITVPGRVLAIRQEPAGAATRPTGKHTGRTGAHRDIYVVIRTVFDTARRQLEDYVRRSRP